MAYKPAFHAYSAVVDSFVIVSFSSRDITYHRVIVD